MLVKDFIVMLQENTQDDNSVVYFEDLVGDCMLKFVDVKVDDNGDVVVELN